MEILCLCPIPSQHTISPFSTGSRPACTPRIGRWKANHKSVAKTASMLAFYCPLIAEEAILCRLSGLSARDQRDVAWPNLAWWTSKAWETVQIKCLIINRPLLKIGTNPPGFPLSDHIRPLVVSSRKCQNDGHIWYTERSTYMKFWNIRSGKPRDLSRLSLKTILRVFLSKYSMKQKAGGLFTNFTFGLILLIPVFILLFLFKWESFVKSKFLELFP